MAESWFKINGEDKTETEFCSWVDDQVKKHPVVKNHHGKWKELLAWEEGNQFTVWNDQKGEVVPATLVMRKVKAQVNMMKPLIETIESKINIAHSVIGTPNSSEMKDIYGAQVATRLINYNDYVNDFDTKLDVMNYDLVRTGQGCIKWIWDTNEYGKVAPKEGGKPNPEKQADEKGEVICHVVPIYNIRPDPTANTIAEARWIIEIMEVTKQEFLAKYPKAKDFVDELNPSAKDKYVGMNVKEEEKDKDEPTYTIKEFWERSSSDYENGRLIVMCQGKSVYEGKNPSPQAKLPYFMFYYKKNPYGFWSHGPLFYVQDIQRITNRLLSMAVEHAEAWRPKMSVGSGALKRANSMTMEALELVEVDYSRGEPRAITMPELSPQVAALRDFFIAALDRVSNVHEVSYSRLPQYASRAPASLYQMMLEQENTKMDPMLKDMNSTLIEQDHFRLELMDQHYKIPRMVKIMGQNKSAMIQYFEAADLHQNYDVRLEFGVSLNQSTSIQLKTMIELYSNGILNEADKPKILKILNLGTAEQELRDDLADTDRALRENQSFIDGNSEKPFGKGGVKIYIHDDHGLHLGYHTNLIKSEEAEQWDKAKYDALDKHINEHFIILAYIKSREAAAAGAVPGQAATATPANPFPPEQPGGGPLGRPAEAPAEQQQPAPGGGSQPSTIA